MTFKIDENASVFTPKKRIPTPSRFVKFLVSIRIAKSIHHAEVLQTYIAIALALVCIFFMFNVTSTESVDPKYHYDVNEPSDGTD